MAFQNYSDPIEYLPDGNVRDEMIDPLARDEFGTLQAASMNGMCDFRHIQRLIGNDFTEDDFSELLDQYPHSLPQSVVALYQLMKTLRQRSVHLLYPHTQTHSSREAKLSGTTYCRDWIGVIDGEMYHTNLQKFRMSERREFEPIFERISTTKRYDIDDILHWGNVMLHKDSLLIGVVGDDYIIKHRSLIDWTVLDSMIRAKNKLQNLLKTNGNTRKIVEVELTHHTDLDLAITPLPTKKSGGKSVVLVSPAVTQRGITALSSVFDEVLRCHEDIKTKSYNVLWLDPETCILPEESTEVRRILEQYRYNVIPLPVKGMLQLNDYDEIGISGGFRCCVGPIRRAQDYIY